MKIRRTLLYGLVPALALVSIVGAGFSTWYFTNQSHTNKEASVFITGYANLGKLTIAPSGNIYLKLDQGEEDDAGIHFVTSDKEGSVTDALTLGYTIESDEDYPVTIPEDKAATLTTTITIPTELDSYFDISIKTNELGVHQLESGSSDAENIVYTFEDEITGLSVGSGAILSVFTFAWDENNKPKNVDAWNALEEKITVDTKVLIDYSLVW